MKTLTITLLLLIAALAGAAVGQNALPAFQPLGIVPTAPSTPTAVAYLDNTGYLVVPQPYIGHQGIIDYCALEARFLGCYAYGVYYSVYQLPQPLLWLQSLSEQMGYSAILPGDTRLRSHPLPTVQ